MVTLKDIAEACGVSPATVSRALNGCTDPAKRNAAMILQTAREMGYYPNAAARTLKTSRSWNIGILYENRLDHEYFSALLTALRECAEEKGYDLTFIRRSKDGEEGGYYERARQRSLDGVMVLQADVYSADVMRLASGSVPAVLIDYVYEGCDSVINDNRGSMEQIVKAVWENGHRRVAFIRGEDCHVTRERLDGFYKSCAERGLRVPAEYVREGHFHEPVHCAGIVKDLLNLPVPPTCILCPDDFSCLGALESLKKRDLKVPKNVSLVGYDGILMTQLTHPRLTTYRQNTEQAARETVSLLLEAIENPETHQPRRVTVPGELIIGETLGKAPKDQGRK